MTRPTATSADVRPYVELLTEARLRTLLLVAPLSGDDLRHPHDREMAPVLRDLARISSYERLWLLGEGSSPRPSPSLPGIVETLEEMAATRERVLRRLATEELDWEQPLLRDGYLFRMVAQHEYQHGESLLQTLKRKPGDPYRAPRALAVPAAGLVETGRDGMVHFPGGEVVMGTADRTEAYDNERPEHLVELAPFWIDATPVTNGAYAGFVREGGYRDERVWSEAGRGWLRETGAEAPLYWAREGEGWVERAFDRVAPLALDHPVCHVSWHEAEAFARWAGKRLPTEAEWEAAASWDPVLRWKRKYPWGEAPPTPLDANVDQLTFSTAPVGAYPGNVSPIGCHGMIGDVWEWTATPFAPHPGYESFPDPEWSEPFFGDEYRVLRGGSWATRAGAVRNTFRAWDFPARRRLHAGFRCARDDR